MLECVFCRKKSKESSVNHIEFEMKEFIKNHNYKYFECDCGNQWIEVNEDVEYFNLYLFNKVIRTFRDFNDLINELSGHMEYYYIAPYIKDSVERINDWIVSGGNPNDSYVLNIIDNIQSLKVFKFKFS